MGQRFGMNPSNNTFKPAPEGKQPAVLAEVSFALVEDRFEDKGLQLKMFWSFQLQAENAGDDNKRYILDLELFPNISAKNKLGKLCQSWSGSRDAFDIEKMNEWRHYVMGDLLERDGEGNLMVDEEGSALAREFDSVEEFLSFVNSEDHAPPPLIGATAILEVVHAESANGKTYANIKNIFPNAQLDNIGNIVRDKATGKMQKAFQMEVDEDYQTREFRQSEIRRRIAEKEAKKNSGGSQSGPKPGVSKKTLPPF